MYPLYDVVTHIHWIYFWWHYFDSKCILVANRFKRLIPPASALQQRRTYRFRGTPIYVINNWLHSLAHLRPRIFLFQPVARHKSLGNRLLNRRREIHIVDAVITSSRIEHPRFKTSWWQLDQ